jgi:hypothetical protein
MDAQEKARRAKEIMEDEVFLGILSDLEAHYVSVWRNTQPAELQKRETAFAAIRVMDDLKGKLHSAATAPKVDAHNNRNAARR